MKNLSLLSSLLLLFVAFCFAQDNSAHGASTFNYIPIIAVLLGAGITQTGNFIFHWYKERQQKILLSVESTSIFKPFTITNKQSPVLNITSASGHPYEFHNLFLSSIHLQNKSNKDFEEFEFIISAPMGYDIIQIAEQTPGDHHVLSKSPDLDFSTRGTKVIIKLNPFNRSDKYSIKIYTTAAQETNEIPLLAFDTKFAVKFITEILKGDGERQNFSAINAWMFTIVTAVCTFGFLTFYFELNDLKKKESIIYSKENLNKLVNGIEFYHFLVKNLDSTITAKNDSLNIYKKTLDSLQKK